MVNCSVSSGIGSGVLALFLLAAVAVAFVTLDVPSELRSICIEQKLPFCEAPAASAPSVKTLPAQRLSDSELNRRVDAELERVKRSSDIGMNTKK